MQKLYFGFQKIIELAYRKLANYGSVLMFHMVRNDKDTWIEDDFCITEDSFRNLIRELSKIKIDFLHISEISNSFKRNRIFITFDDGFDDVYIRAYPILKEYNIPFCVFITIDKINKKNYLNTKMIYELSNDPLCTFGAHTFSHPILRFCSTETSKDEITNSKYYLEEKLGKSIDYFAYPYGSIYACSLKNIEQVKRSEYKYGFSTINTHLNKFSINSKYFIPRLNVNEENWGEIIRKL